MFKYLRVAWLRGSGAEELFSIVQDRCPFDGIRNPAGDAHAAAGDPAADEDDDDHADGVCAVAASQQ